MEFDYKVVSRNPTEKQLSYKELSHKNLDHYLLIINCTPLGTFPNVEEYPPIPYHLITKEHSLIDLIYNPGKTEFLKMGFASGAKIANGQKMLEQQALKSWSIWKS